MEKHNLYLVTLLVPLIGVLGASYIQRRNARRAAGQKLIEAFNKVLIVLDPNNGEKNLNVDSLLRASFDDLNNAIGNFQHHLFWWEKKGFNKAWVTYYGDGDDRCQNYLQYMAFNSNPDALEIFRNNVNAILKFANQK